MLEVILYILLGIGILLLLTMMFSFFTFLISDLVSRFREMRKSKDSIE